MLNRYSVALVAVTTWSLLTPLVLAQRANEQRQKWEYKIVNYCDAADAREINIHQLGEEGWELVSTDPGIGGEAQSCQIHYFKRPKQATRQLSGAASAPTPAAPRCALSLEKAPAIRGVRLGTSADELFALFPVTSEQSGFRAVLKRAEQTPNNYGVGHLSLTSYGQPPPNKELPPEIHSLAVTFFDSNVVQLHVSVNPTDPARATSWTIESWVAKLTELFGLPGLAYWEPTAQRQRRILRCQDFEVETSIQNYQRGIPGNPTQVEVSAPQITITSLLYRRALEQRIKDDQERRRRAFKF